jgi:hypothetical protein
MLIKEVLPKPALQEFVRKYQIISWHFEASAYTPPKVLAPRPEHSLAFYVNALPNTSLPKGIAKNAENNVPFVGLPMAKPE